MSLIVPDQMKNQLLAMNYNNISTQAFRNIYFLDC